MIRKYSTVDRDYVADKLIELAQELLHGKNTYAICGQGTDGQGTP
jgi:hypothetical protein